MDNDKYVSSIYIMKCFFPFNSLLIMLESK